MLVERGATLIDADVLARDAVRPGRTAFAAIVERWGASVVGSGGELDRPALRRIVFGDEAERRALDAIVHPEVARLRQDAIRDAAAGGAAVVVCDIPLLFEADRASAFDRIVLVDAPEEVRLDRLVRDRGLSPAEAAAMIAAQMPAAGKRRMADHVIDNDGTLADLEERVEALWRDLSAAAGTA
jgi:dephospho-CoA kinase